MCRTRRSHNAIFHENVMMTMSFLDRGSFDWGNEPTFFWGSNFLTNVKREGMNAYKNSIGIFYEAWSEGSERHGRLTSLQK